MFGHDRTNGSFLIIVLLLGSAFPARASGVAEDVATAPEVPTLVDSRGVEVTVTDASRVVTLGSAVTEIAFAVDRGNRVVGVDSSSAYPAESLEGVPRTGYVRALSAEGVLSLDPSLIIGSADVGPPEVIEQLEDAGVPVFILPEDDSFEGAKERVALVGELLDAETEAGKVIAEIQRDAKLAEDIVAAVPAEERARVMFIYARGVGALSVSGVGTSAHAVIELAGGRNAVTEYEGYRPLTAESAVAIDPEVLIFLESGLQSIGGKEGLREVPGITETAAFENERILAFDGTYLLGFGPRVGQAVLELTQALYPETEATP